MADPTPACINCGRRNKVQRIGQEMFRCLGCGATWDLDPNEGGTHYTDPTRRIELEDEQRARKVNRLGRRK